MTMLRMTIRRAVIVATTLVVATWTAAAAMNTAQDFSISLHSRSDSLRAGSDSLRVTLLLTGLERGDPLVCELLADQIGNFWSDGDHDGIGRFADASKSLRLAKDSLHGSIGGAGALALLVNTLDTDNACVRRIAAKLLGRSRIEPARLTALLNDPSPRRREAVAYAIGTGSDSHKVSRTALEKMLRERGATEAAMAAWALGEIEDSASVPALEQAVRATDVRVRLAAVDALGNIEDKRALKELERSLRSDAEASVRARAANAIGNIGEASSVDALAAAVEDKVPQVQYAAVEALADLDELHRAPESLLRAAATSDAQLRKHVARALAEIRDPLSVNALLSLIDVNDRDVRVNIAEALGDIGSSKASAGLLKLLKDPDAEVRRAAAEALGEIDKEN